MQQSCMRRPNEYNIIQHRGKQKKCCIVQHLFSEKFDRDQTSYNKVQHDKTRYNKVAKRVQHFIKHQSCMMLYEMLYSFGRGFTLNSSKFRMVYKVDGSPSLIHVIGASTRTSLSLGSYF